MISNNYVPEWYISPFEHSKYTLARNQMHMDLLFDDMNDSDEFLSLGCPAQVDYYDGGKHCIVQLGDCSERTMIEIHGLLLHEAVHIWQRIRKLMGEKEPSSEFEAYSIQRIAQDLFAMFQESETDGLEKQTE
ncbi:hypothetical protein J2X86_000349 [Acinetobacter lwoffii]|uniref:Uncharacterized protein n=1 Tax=Acinetobacter lwoffii TaxID=28090 RepID=A0AAW8LFG3_ACILW|nr:hypothetical protein [Acinetobacter lwoffii]MDR6628361.1 hypothetical protein [Acinetobacter lwoffii]